ncbi:MAG: HlyU family transcriptional regulator [Pelagimonas sp.]|jgi:hypothetical protein|nr:HlyU family transcriptional regulator [Pelagimonas sp.]
MSLFKKLFGGGGAKSPAAEPIEYKGFLIFPDPVPEDGQFRLAARIEKEINGEAKVHHLIRADVIRDRDQAIDAALRKARQMIDMQGERIFR